MKHISNLLNSEAISDSKYPKEELVLDSQTISIINDIFKELRIIIPAYRYTWNTQIELDDLKRSWAKALIMSKTTDLKKIEHAIDKLRLKSVTFWPSVGEFISLCEVTAEDLGLPPMHIAYREACLKSHPSSDKNFSHPAIQHAVNLTTTHILANFPEKQSRPLFEMNYELTIKMLMNGQELMPVKKAITENVQKPRTKETAFSHLSAMKNLLR